MNEAHFHLAINHLPIITPIVGLIVLIIGILFKSDIVQRVSYFLFIIGAICTLPAFASGEGAEEIAEGLQGMSHQLIHEHEEKAEGFALLSYLLGAISLIALWASWKQQQFAKLFSFVILALGFVVIYKGREVGTSGGEIRHAEIRKGFVPTEENEHEEE